VIVAPADPTGCAI